MPINEYGTYDLCSMYILEATSYASGKWFISRISCEEFAGQLYSRLFYTYFRKVNMGYLFDIEGFVGLQYAASYTLYKLYLMDNHWKSIDNSIGDILLPIVQEQLDSVEVGEDYVYNFLISPLYFFGLLETRQSNSISDRPYALPNEFRKNPLFEQLFTFNVERTQPRGLNGNVIPLNNKSVGTRKQSSRKNVQTMDPKIYQLKISLNDIKPPIWRRLLVRSDTLLPDLHKIIQSSMGWMNGHMHQFEMNGQYYSAPVVDWPGNEIDYRNIRIDDLLKGNKQKMTYEYDFGDGWMHTILLEKSLPVDSDTSYPVCTAGKRNCPPDDSGGPWGYQEMLEALDDPGHAEHEMYKDWISTDFDSEHFDKDEINELLHRKNYGVFEMF